jgi:kinesin family member 11
VQAIGAKNTAIQASTKAVYGETVKIVDAQVQEMSTQMAALDEFVTRARTQNDESHNDHLEGLTQFQSEVLQLQGEVAENLEQRANDLQVLANEHSSSNAELLECTNAFGAEAKEALQSIRTQIDEHSMRDYEPTGETPQKKNWSLPSDLPSTANHQSIIARMRGLPDPGLDSTSRTPARSPKKQGSPRKSPTKSRSPKKGKVYADKMGIRPLMLDNMTEPIKGLKEVDMNVVAGANGLGDGSHTVSFSKSISSGQPPLKRHATATAVTGENVRLGGKVTRSKAAAAGGLTVEYLSQSVGPGTGRRLRNSPQ